jgi:hypothetical protein
MILTWLEQQDSLSCMIARKDKGVTEQASQSTRLHDATITAACVRQRQIDNPRTYRAKPFSGFCRWPYAESRQ